ASVVSLFPNLTLNNTLTFGTRADVTVGASPTSVATGDFDQDTNLDLAVSSSVADGAGNFKFSVLPGLGNDNFGAVRDFIVGTAAAGTQLLIFQNNDSATFTGLPPIAVPANSLGLTLADLNGDNLPEILLTQNVGNSTTGTSGTLTVLQNASIVGSTTFTT